MNNLVKNLHSRGMIHDIIPGTEALLLSESISGYIGFDSTAPSLHIGNLASIMLLKHLQICGHKPIALIGGATTMIGDPGGKNKERELLEESIIKHNQLKIKEQLEKFLDFDTKINPAEIVNNYDWLKNFSFIEFLRSIGKHIPLGYMTQKESVKKRLETGISYAEFSYQLLQGYDFYFLFKNKGVKLQMGGSDQWGNLTTGTELIRRKLNKSAYAITTPLVTKADGTKFGKSETGSIWLDPTMTSPYKFFQFLLNVSDIEAAKYIKIFTLLPIDEIEDLENKNKKEPHNRILQNALAKYLTIKIHSLDDYNQALKASNILFGKNTTHELSIIDEKTFLEIFEGVPKIIVGKSNVNSETSIIDLLSTLTENKIFKSKKEVRRSIIGSSLYINKVKIENQNAKFNMHLINNKYILVQNGKKNYFIIQVS